MSGIDLAFFCRSGGSFGLGGSHIVDPCPNITAAFPVANPPFVPSALHNADANFLSEEFVSTVTPKYSGIPMAPNVPILSQTKIFALPRASSIWTANIIASACWSYVATYTILPAYDLSKCAISFSWLGDNLRGCISTREPLNNHCH